MSKLIIGYIRVSTQSKASPGRGLEAQQTALEDMPNPLAAGSSRFTWRLKPASGLIVRSWQKALLHAKSSNATLVIAKLDRLARNVHFVSGLMESGVDFGSRDNPHAKELTIHILAAIAEHEAEAISERTKDALAAYKARGGVLDAMPKAPIASRGRRPQRWRCRQAYCSRNYQGNVFGHYTINFNGGRPD